MGRLPRFDASGAVHHVWSRGTGPAAIFADVEDRLAFLGIVASVFGRFEVECLAYCLMTTHYHFVLRTAEANLSTAMQRVNGQYARSFNCRHGRWGHLYGARFGSTFVQTQEHLLVALRYVFLNPLADPRCRHPADWAWSSYANAVAAQADPLAATDELLALVGGADRLRDVVEQPRFPCSLQLETAQSPAT